MLAEAGRAARGSGKADAARGERLREELLGLLRAQGSSELEARVSVDGLRASAFGGSWRESLVRLETACGLTGPAVCNMLARFSALLAFPPATIEAAADVLRGELKLTPKDTRYLLSRRPSLFACPPAHLVAAWEALAAMGLNARQRHALVKTNPGLLALAPDCYARFRAALVGPRSGLKVSDSSRPRETSD